MGTAPEAGLAGQMSTAPAPRLAAATARDMAPVAVWLVLRLVTVPAGLSADAWHYFAVFAAAIVALVLTRLPGGAIGLVAVSLITALGHVDHDPAKSIAWALGSFADTTVWLTFGAFCSQSTLMDAPPTNAAGP